MNKYKKRSDNIIELNKVYYMDNLELLKQMQDESVDLIYCDILYNTGKKFRDYDDDLGTTQQAIEWYRPRIIEMKRILKDTGSVYLQCDYRLVHYLKVEMDNIFGVENFQNDIVWCYNGGGVTKKRFNKKHDNILFYSNSSEFNFNTQYQPYKANSANRLSNAHNNKKTKEEISRGTPMVDWWSDIKAIVNPDNKEYVPYQTQKPKALLERIIKASSNKGDTVADFFCGSGTTGVVAKELGRNYIMCDISEKAVEISNKRLNEI